MGLQQNSQQQKHLHIYARLCTRHTNSISTYIFTKNTFAPSPYQALVYGRKQQTTNIIETPTFTDKQQKQLQKIVSKFFYYARAIDNTMMHALNDLASQITTVNVQNSSYLNVVSEKGK